MRTVGIVAAAFDDVTGFVIGRLQEPAFTGELTVRYLAPVPVDEPLEIRARLDGRERRKLFISAEARAGETVVATCRAIYITVDPSRFAGRARPPLTRSSRRNRSRSGNSRDAVPMQSLGRLVRCRGPSGSEPMSELLTIERVAVLQRVGMFADVPGHTLVAVARLLEEVPVEARRDDHRTRRGRGLALRGQHGPDPGAHR